MLLLLSLETMRRTDKETRREGARERETDREKLCDIIRPLCYTVQINCFAGWYGINGVDQRVLIFFVRFMRRIASLETSQANMRATT